MPTSASCWDCMQDGPVVEPPKPPKPELVIIEATFEARYEGECPECEYLIAPGQVIHKLSNGRYVHQGCEP